MTESTTIIERGNDGDHRYVVAEVDITSLANVGNEPFDPGAKFNLDGAYGTVLDQEDYTYVTFYDAGNTQLIVKDVADGSDITDTTDVGTVTLKFEGDWSA